MSNIEYEAVKPEKGSLSWVTKILMCLWYEEKITPDEYGNLMSSLIIMETE